MAAICLAIAAAVCYAAAMVLEQHSAHRTAPDLSLRPSLLVELARRPAWLAGLAANVVGYGLRFAALGIGSLLVVQPLLGTSLLFALPASARWNGERLHPTDWLAAVAIVVGLALFLVPAGTHAGTGRAGLVRWAEVVTVAAIVVVSLLWRASLTSGGGRARLLAAAGGVLLALAAAFTKLTAVGARHHLLRLPATWPPYALVVVAVAGVLVVQSAFAGAPLSTSLPVLMVVEPLASIGVGLAVLGERVATGLSGRLVEVAGLGLMTAGIIAAARSPMLARHEVLPT